MELNGKASPYKFLKIKSKIISDKQNYVAKQLNPVFGKCFEFEATLPEDSMLSVQVFNRDLAGQDDLISETKIDLENRFYTGHRATCGLPVNYEEQGSNRWRDDLKPTQILAKLCMDRNLDSPDYSDDCVYIENMCFNVPIDSDLLLNPDTHEEQMALAVLHRWQEVPGVGTGLDIFPTDMPQSPPPSAIDISPRKPKSYELRVIIRNTQDVVLQNKELYCDKRKSDICVKGWLCGPDDCQTTDIHHRSLTGEGNFNWRFIYPFDYLEDEQRIVISRKESLFSTDELVRKIPARLELQVLDGYQKTTGDFLGALMLDLSSIPLGARSAKECSLEILRENTTIPTISLFTCKCVEGWWPLCVNNNNVNKLVGKVEIEMQLLTGEEAKKAPAGHGRSEPDPLETPKRPYLSIQWTLNPLNAFRYRSIYGSIWRYYRGTIIKNTMFFLAAITFFFLFYVLPHLVKRYQS